MIVLKQVIKYDNAPALEATWVIRDQLPDTQVPASPALYDAGGKEVQAAVEAHTVPCAVLETVVKCQAYSADQMGMLAADLGDDAPTYQALMDEIAAQYVPPEPQAIPVPQVISRRQAKQVLLQVGLLDVVEAAIAASGDRAAQIDWADAQELRRDWATLTSMQDALGLTDEQIDGLFRLAATL